MVSISEDKLMLLQQYSIEFENEYLMQDKGQKHLHEFKKEQEEVKSYWSEIKQKKQEGGDITGLVLSKLLPYSNTVHNRQMNYRISVTPAITKDIKKWFENAGWQISSNWPKVAANIYGLIYEVIENNNLNYFKVFEENRELSKGIKSGFITPTLHCLNPNLRIINNKTVDTINYIAGKKLIDRDLTNYIKYLELIKETIIRMEISMFEDVNVFDMFCHWMCNKRLGGYARLSNENNEPGEAFNDVEDEEAVPSFETEIEPTNHWEAIYYIVQIGNLLGYKTYVADPSKVAFGKKLEEIRILSEVPPTLSSVSEIRRVDVIWYKALPPYFFFEVEDGGNMRDALHRLYNTIAFNAKFFIISPEENRSKFIKWVETEPYHEYRESYNFRTYKELYEFYLEVKNYSQMCQKFLKHFIMF